MISIILYIALGFILNMIYRSLKIKNLPENPAITTRQTTYGKYNTKYSANLVYYYHVGRHPNIASPSPFCLKLETFFKIANIEYKDKVDMGKKTASHKFPYIVYNGRLIEDSEKCIQFLMKEYNITIDDDLTNEQILMGKMIQKMLEKSTYFWVIRLRWNDPVNFKGYKQVLFGKVPKFIRGVVSQVVRNEVVDSLWYQGAGRYDLKDVYKNIEQEIQCCSEVLGDNKYLLGDKISSYDAGFYGMIANCLVPFPHDWIRECVRRHANLVQYCKRMNEMYYK